jgi:hypothetical protein
MKRQGKYGFTFDSKAEEEYCWAISCLEHNPPPKAKALRRLADHANDMQMLAIAQRNRMAELDAVCTQIARPVPLWPIAAFAAVAATLAMVIASVEGWI